MMNTLDLTRSFAPAEIKALRRWLPWAVIALGIAAGAELIRGGGARALALGVGMALLLACRLCLPDGQRPWKQRAALLAALLAGGTSVWLLLAGGLSALDLWAGAWLTAPALLSVFWMLHRPVAIWAGARFDAGFIDRALSRNRVLDPKLRRIGAHVLLLHAVIPVLIPLVWIADVAVSPGNTLGGAIGDAFTLEHFATVLQSGNFRTWLTNSLVVSVGTTVAGLLLAIPAGYAFSRYRFYARRGAMFAFILIQMFPGIIILLPYFMIMKTLGLLNTSLGLIIAYSVTALPLCVWMLKGFFDTIPREVEEAALIDGCSQMQIFRGIILPLSLPAIAVTALFSFLTAWNEFLLALIFNTSNDQYTLPVGLASMIPATGQQWGDFAAASILVSIPVVILFIAFQKSLVQGLSAGAVKG